MVELKGVVYCLVDTSVAGPGNPNTAELFKLEEIKGKKQYIPAFPVGQNKLIKSIKLISKINDKLCIIVKNTLNEYQIISIDANGDFALAYFNLGVLYDLYLGRPELALQYYEGYQLRRRPAAVDQKDVVDTWIIDLRRRVGKPQQAAKVQP